MQKICPYMDKILSHFCYKTGEKVAFLSKMWAADVPAAIYIYIHIYMCACCRVNNLATFWPFQGQ